MRTAKAPDLDRLITSCPVHKAIVKAVGYGSRPCQEIVEQLKDVVAAHGRAAVDGVATALLDYEQHGTALYAKLKPALHVYCRTLLGPMPSEWATWWQNADGSDRKGKPKDWPPKLPGLAELTAEEAALAALTTEELSKQLHAARLRLVQNRSPTSRKQAHDEVQQLLAEYARRNRVPPPELTSVEPDSKETERLGRVSEDQLGCELQAARERYNRFSPGSKAGKEASHRIDLLYAEYQRRGLTIPAAMTDQEAKRRVRRKPAAPTVEPPDTPAEKPPAVPQTFDAPGFRDFGQATSARLKELLDMCQYELTRSEPGEVTFDEALWDIGLIEAELKRRDEPIDESAAA